MVLDKRLLARISEYIATQGGTSSIADVTQYLQKKYSEYGRRKRQAFQGMVQRGHMQLAPINKTKAYQQLQL
jgi:hypothetical protein